MGSGLPMDLDGTLGSQNKSLFPDPQICGFEKSDMKIHKNELTSKS